MPLTPRFFEAVHVLDKNWSMGVELMSPFLYSLIRCTRPRGVLEVGAGYSSLFILQALADNLEEFKQNKKLVEGHVRSDQHVRWKRLFRGRHPLPLALPEYYESEYSPKLAVIDDVSHPATSAGVVESVANKLQLGQLLKFYEGDFRGMSRKLEQQLLPLDFVWFDCGAFKEYSDFLEEYWDLINPEGGLLLLHSTLTNALIQSVIRGLKLKQVTGHFNRFEMLSLLEPHKWRQNSVTMIRMISPKTDKIYTMGP